DFRPGAEPEPELAEPAIEAAPGPESATEPEPVPAISPPQWESPDSLAGFEFADNFLLLRPLSSSPEKRSYIAETIDVGLPVVVQLLGPHHGPDSAVARQFRAHYQALEQVQHPRIPTIHEVGVSNQVTFVAMPFFDGADLGQLLKREQVIAWKRALSLIRQVLEGLEVLHATGLYHGDLTPQNCMCINPGAQEQLKLLNATIPPLHGVYHNEDGPVVAPSLGGVGGTAEYLAPERTLGAPASAEADLYAAGAILYELIRGAPAFESDSFGGVLAKQQTEEAPPLSAVCEQVLPSALEDVIARALAKDPSQRFGTASELLTALDSAETAGAKFAEPEAPLEPAAAA
ncbi:MAG: serine/threonine-protein kinase, partial [Nannocystaceae bacterium]